MKPLPYLLLLGVSIFSSGKTMANATVHEEGWNHIQDLRQQHIDQYLEANQVAYRWFADFPLGLNDGVPYIILKLLPKVAPEYWGGDDNFLDVIGLFKDERIPDYPIARGIGWSGLGREGADNVVDYASFTCGACHIGRVRTDSGIRYLDGGVNAHFNLPQYRVRAYQTIEKIIDGAASDAQQLELATNAFVSALDAVHKKDKNYFYGSYNIGAKYFDNKYEQQQVDLFRKNARDLVEKFLVRTRLEYAALGVLVDKNYRGFEQEMLTGFGGMADATGVSTSFAYVVDRDIYHKKVDPDSLPPSQGITDFMVVWEQNKRKVKWSADHKKLIEGGGQWNGNIPISMFRNLAAELTMGFGAQTDLRVGAFAEQLLDGLPAPVYPFTVDIKKARKGHALFEKNCAACHKPHNGEIYQVGTDSGRAHVANEMITAAGRQSFTSICSPTTTINLPGQGDVKPCAEFEGVSLVGNSQFAMMDPKQHDGYNALPLGGVWAQAPYLHNGSVPTIFHLLVPSERPDVFMKSRLDYDQKLLGFSWALSKENNKREEGYKFNTNAIPAFSNKGHDKDIVINGATHKLDWSDDKDGAMAIIEYMKTL